MKKKGYALKKKKKKYVKVTDEQNEEPTRPPALNVFLEKQRLRSAKILRLAWIAGLAVILIAIMITLA